MWASLSDRDKKLLLILLIAVVIFCPWYFLIKPKNANTAELKADNKTKQERYDYLVELNAHRDEYIKETEKFEKDTKKIVDKYPSDVKPENYAQYLLNIEMYEAALDEPNPFIFYEITFGDNIESAVGSDEVTTGYSAIVNESSVRYTCFYPGVKDVLAYLADYKDPMTYRGFSCEFDSSTGQLKGEIIIDQYAIKGGDKTELPKVKINPNLDEWNLRGNPDAESIFGTRTMDFDSDEDDGGDGVGANEEPTEEPAED